MVMDEYEWPDDYDRPESCENDLDKAEDLLDTLVAQDCPKCDGQGCDVCDGTGDRHCPHGLEGEPGDWESCELCADEIDILTAKLRGIVITPCEHGRIPEHCAIRTCRPQIDDMEP